MQAKPSFCSILMPLPNIHVKCAALLLLMSCLPGLSIAQDSAFQFVESLTIGDDEQADIEYLFTGLRHVTTDSDGNIYVADGRISEIRVFSEEGNHIKTIGRQGQGPGEFAEISALAISEQSSDLIIADNTNRRFTVFSDLDTQPQTITYPSARLEIGELHSFGQSYLASGFERSSEYAEAGLVAHVFSDDLSVLLSSTARADTWWDFKEPFSEAQQSSISIVVEPEDEHSFLLVPTFYGGQIYRYKRSGGEWEWQVLQGREKATPPYRLHDVNNPGQAPNPKRLYNTTAGRFVASIHRLSVGLFSLRDGSIIHFTYEKRGENDSSLYVELFNTDGQLLKTGPVEGYAEEGVSAFGTEVLWKDERDRFYIVDKRGDFPVLRRGALNW